MPLLWTRCVEIDDLIRQYWHCQRDRQKIRSSWGLVTVPYTSSIFTLLGAIVIYPNHASAVNLPQLSPERYCDEVAQMSGGSPMIRNGCVEMEQDAYTSSGGYREAFRHSHVDITLKLPKFQEVATPHSLGV